ncbi:MAG: cardiolipin synthase [Janthinobacterium lividum]
MQWNTFTALGLTVLLAHVLGIIAAGHAIVTARTSQGAVAWTVSLVAVPYVTLIPYLFLGQSRFSGYVDARRIKGRMLRETAPPPGWNRSHAERRGAAACIGDRSMRALESMTDTPCLHGNRVRVLVNGERTFTAIFEAIAKAESYVLVQFFIIRDDGLGRRLQQALSACARRGVRVHLLYDGVGSRTLSRRYIADLRADGIEVHDFATHKRFANRLQLNFRNHRKIVVVDGHTAFVGGLNVGDEYLGLKPPLAPWRDTHIEVAGPAVDAIQFSFVEDWYWATQRLLSVAYCEAASDADMACQVMVSGPADSQETCSLFFVEAIGAAQRRLWLTTPYFVPDEAVFAALRLAAMRGVDVRVMIPARPDKWGVFEASTLYAFDALRAGVRVFRYQPGFLHQKVMLIDDTAAAVGSANLDNRSFRLNFEITVLTVDRRFAADVAAMLEEDFSVSREIDVSEYQHKAALRRMGMHVARLFAPVL